MKKSKALAGVILIIVIAFICITYSYREAWWSFIDLFCFFMASFLHLLALMQPAPLAIAARRIDRLAAYFGILGVLALIGEFIAYFCLLD